MTVILSNLKECTNVEHEGVWRVMQLFDSVRKPTSIMVDVGEKQFFYKNEDYMLLKVTEY